MHLHLWMNIISLTKLWSTAYKAPNNWLDKYNNSGYRIFKNMGSESCCNFSFTSTFWGHSLPKYSCSCNFSGCVLQFRSQNVKNELMDRRSTLFIASLSFWSCFNSAVRRSVSSSVVSNLASNSVSSIGHLLLHNFLTASLSRTLKRYLQPVN